MHECLRACVCAWVRACLCWGGYTRASLSVGIRSQFGVLLLKCNPLYLKAGSPTVLEFTKWAGLASSGPQGLMCLFIFQTLGLQTWVSLTDFFTCVFGIELESLCLRSTHFHDCVICPNLDLFFDTLSDWIKKKMSQLPSHEIKNLQGSLYVVLEPMARRGRREEFTHV